MPVISCTDEQGISREAATHYSLDRSPRSPATKRSSAEGAADPGTTTQCWRYEQLVTPPTEPETVTEELKEPSGERVQTITPAQTGMPGEILIAPEPGSIPEQIPSRPDERPRENLPNTQKHS